MFERYTEYARRTIFFGRYEASQFGSPYIETEHLLLGLLREDKVLANRLLGSPTAVESIRKQIERHTPPREKTLFSVDLPLSHECMRVLAYGSEEAQRLNDQHIGTEHLLLGLLREQKCFAAQLLGGQGLTLDSVREQVEHSKPMAAESGSASLGRLDRWLAERQARGGIHTVKQERVANRTAQFAIYAADQAKENEPPPRVPLLCIEIIRDERFSAVQRRCDDYIAGGVAQVWLLDFDLKRAYTVTEGEGLREFRGEILRIADPPVEMDLRTIFD
jgi:ATP-dependent Clp protease ATP-binding subunit ClpA